MVFFFLFWCFFPTLKLAGSLIILAENVMGSTVINESGETILQYGKRCDSIFVSLLVNNHCCQIDSPKHQFDCAGVQDASYKMSKFSMKELIGNLGTTYTGSMMLIGLRL